MDYQELKKQLRSKDKLIAFLNGKFEKTVQESQYYLQQKVTEDILELFDVDEKTKRIRNNQYNRNLLLNVDKIYKDFADNRNPLLFKDLLTGVAMLLDFNKNYYTNLTIMPKILPLSKKIKEHIKQWLGIKNGRVEANGYLDTLVKGEVVKNQIKSQVLKMVYGQSGWREAKEGVNKLIQGSKLELGALERYHRNFSYDLYSQIDRATGKAYADGLKFDFAIYEGGIIKTSRKFCREHNGKVFHRKEIQDFNPLEAKPPGYNPFTDLGGYGCRHHLNWIPNALAFSFRPDAKELVG